MPAELPLSHYFFLNSHNLQSSLPTTGSTQCSTKVSFSLSTFDLHQTMTLTWALGYSTLCSLLLSKHVLNLPNSLGLRNPGVIPRCFQTFLLSQGQLFHLPWCPQSASSSHAHYTLSPFWIENTSLFGISGRAKMPSKCRL